MSTREERLARAERSSRETMRLHALDRGKVQVMPKCPIRDPGDFSIWYTPGVAGLTATPDQRLEAAAGRMQSAREAVRHLIETGVIPPAPAGAVTRPA